MFKTVIQGRRIITPDGLQDGYLVLEDGKIISVASGTYEAVEPSTKMVNAGDRYVSPGLIDIHTYGGGKDGFHHLGIVESGYIFDDLDVEIIADGCHITPELLRMTCQANGGKGAVPQRKNGKGYPCCAV